MLVKILLIFGGLFLLVFLGFTLLIGMLRRIFGWMIPGIAPKKQSFSFSFGRNNGGAVPNADSVVYKGDSTVVLQGEAPNSGNTILPTKEQLPSGKIIDATVKEQKDQSSSPDTVSGGT